MSLWRFVIAQGVTEEDATVETQTVDFHGDLTRDFH
jgi:hypothetical protein